MENELQNDKAYEFMKKFFEDEDFAKVIFTKAWCLRKKDPTTGKEADLKRMVTVAKELEYEMTEDDYIKANEKYLNEIGGFNTLKALVRLHTLRTKVENNIVNNE